MLVVISESATENILSEKVFVKVKPAKAVIHVLEKYSRKNLLLS